MNLLVFIGWSVVCFLGSTGPAGALRATVQRWVFAWLGLGSGPVGVGAEVLQGLIQKTPHLLVFGVLGYLAAREPERGTRMWLLGAAVVVAIAAELVQGLTLTRGLTAGDVVLNLVAVLGVALWWRARVLANGTEAPKH